MGSITIFKLKKDSLMFPLVSARQILFVSLSTFTMCNFIELVHVCVCLPPTNWLVYTGLIRLLLVFCSDKAPKRLGHGITSNR